MRVDKSSGADPYDAYIGRCIQNWLALTPPPPRHGKEHLLREASMIKLEKSSRWGVLILLKHYFLVTLEYLLGILEADRQHQLSHPANVSTSDFLFTYSREDYMLTYTSRGSFLGVFS